MNDLTLVETPQYDGYYFDDIVKYLGGKKSDKGKRFIEWMNGQTCGFEEGKVIVYRWDFERFIRILGGYKEHPLEWD